ncbi:MAG: DUF2079 domain-containing protein [Candidatus Omnitrophica bacterium]|nr:DUF2079 domain-containing protein [Candidatus Omnitrophota bacterium]
MLNFNWVTDAGEDVKDRIVWLLIAAYISCFGYISFLKYQSFGYQDFDLAVYSQTLWNILHGSTYNSILGIDFLGNHAGFILFLIAPVYFVFKSPLTLLFIQSISLGIAAYPIYLIAKKELNRNIGLAIVSIYLIYPAVGYVNLFEFHPQTLAVPFLIFTYYYFEKENFKMFVIFMSLSLMCQENIALIIALFGICTFFIKKDIKWLLTPLLIGMAWFCIMVFKIIPYFNKGTIDFISIYNHIGNSLPEVLGSIVLHPIKIIKIMFEWQKMIYLSQIFLPVSFLSLFDLRIFIVAPIFIQHLLSLRPSEYDISTHYAAELIPFIFISTIYGIKRIISTSQLKARIIKRFFILAILIISVISNIYLGPQSRLIKYSKDFKKDISDYIKQSFVNKIPETAGVVSTFEFLPKLSNRNYLYSFHHVVNGFYTLSNKPYVFPENAEYALLDFNDSLTFDSFYIPGSDVNLRKFILTGKWGVVDMAGSIVLLRKNYSGNYRLYRVFDKMPVITHEGLVKIDNNLEFLGYDAVFKNSQVKKQIKLTFFWRATEQLKKDYESFIDILNSDGVLQYRFKKSICYRIYPTYAWQKGEIVSEDYVIFIPEDVKNGYSVEMRIFDCKTGSPYKMFSVVENLMYKGNIINLADKEGTER